MRVVKRIVNKAMLYRVIMSIVEMCVHIILITYDVIPES